MQLTASLAQRTPKMSVVVALGPAAPSSDATSAARSVSRPSSSPTVYERQAEGENFSACAGSNSAAS